MKTGLTRKQQEALASLVLSRVADIAEYEEIRELSDEIKELPTEQIKLQLSVWMKKLPGTIWDNRLPQ